MRTFALLLAALLAAGCTSMGQGADSDLQILEDLSPYEVRVRVVNPTDAPLQVEPHMFRIEGADGTVFAGGPSPREGALKATLLGPGDAAEGWVYFLVEGKAVAPLNLVLETEPVRLHATLSPP